MIDENFVKRGQGRPVKVKVVDTNVLLIDEVNETILALKDLRTKTMTLVKKLLKKVEGSENTELYLGAITVVSNAMKSFGTNIGTLKRATEKLPATPPPKDEDNGEQAVMSEWVDN